MILDRSLYIYGHLDGAAQMDHESGLEGEDVGHRVERMTITQIPD